MLSKIIGGWSWNSYHGEARERQLVEDAETCFQFLCDSYGEAPWVQQQFQSLEGHHPPVEQGDGRVRKGILQLFRDHLEPSDPLGYGAGYWRAYDLDPWILREGTSPDIVLTLIKARTRIGNLGLREEVRFLEQFHLDHRSQSATALAGTYLSQIRETDELAWEIVRRVRPANRRGDTNPSTPFNFGDVDEVRWRVNSPEQAWVTIVFRRDPDQAAINQVREVRDQVLSDVEKSTRTVLIEAEGKDGFSYREE